MLDFQSNRIIGNPRRACALQGVSGLALFVAGLSWATPVAAQQATPGSAQCPLVNGVVTCTGAIPLGFRAGEDGGTFDRIVFRGLTAPIRPAPLTNGIEIGGRNATITLDRTVDIGITNVSAFSNIFSGIRLSSGNFDLTNDGTITVNGRQTSAAIYYTGDPTARTARIVNNGAISVGGGTVMNDSRLRNYGILLEAASNVSIVNNGMLTGRGPYVNPIELLNLQPTSAVDRIEIVNTGTIRGSAATDPRAFSSSFRTQGGMMLRYPGAGTVSIRNSGLMEDGAIVLSRPRTTIGAPGGDANIIIENTGDLVRSGVNVLTDFESFFSASTARNPNNYTVSISNSGTLTDSSIDLELQNVASANVTITNTGTITNSRPADDRENFVGITAALESYTTRSGRADLLIVNEGAITMSNTMSDSSSHAISGSASDTLTVLNSAPIRITGDAIGIIMSQGQNYFNQSVSEPGRIGFGGYDSVATLVNNGSIDTDWVASRLERHAILVRANGNIDIRNSGRLNLSAARNSYVTDSFYPNLEIGPINYGIRVLGFIDARVVNSAAIDISGVQAAGIYVTAEDVNDINYSRRGESTFFAPSYDRAADLGSNFSIAVDADVSALGRGSVGIMGELGFANERVGPNSSNKFAFEHGDSSLSILVAPGVTVAGGTGVGSGIFVQGGGRVLLDNRGTVSNLGDAGTGAVLLGANTFNARYQSLDVGPDGTTVIADRTLDPSLRLNLVDSINTGTIISSGGFGIRTANGGILNLRNSGLIRGGEGSVAAVYASSITNEAGGTLDGRIALTGTGSILTNAGSIQVSSPAFVRHEISGDYIQTASGSLALRSGATGRDTFSVTGNMVLDGTLALALGAPSSAAIINVGGNLTLGGTLNVTDAGGFGDGVYRLFDYSGTLTNNGLTVGSLPNGANGNVQTVFPKQVNLVVGSGLQFWDGAGITANLAVDGGSGTWNNSSTNWTRSAGDVNETWQSRGAVFQGTPGVVTIVPGGVSASGLQFAVDGYRIEGGPLTLTAPASLRVGDGSAGGAGYSATIASAIGGAGGIEKTDFGTLILSGTNSYAGGTRISGGVLQVGADANLGAALGGLTLNGGTLRTSAGFASDRALAVTTAGGTIDTGANRLALSGGLTGSGALTKVGSGTLALSGDAGSFTGQTTVAAGTLDLGTTLGGTLSVGSGATLAGGGSAGATTILGGGILSPGGAGVGTLTLASLTLSEGSRLTFELGAPGVVGGTANDLVRVTGNLTLDGTLDVTALPGFGEGVYRLIDYGGALTDNGLVLGSVPGSTQVQTILPGQVNLVVGTALQYWDGAGTVANLRVDGGNGTWNNTTSNWTRVAGDVNESWGRGFAVFQGTPGTVTIASDGVAATGLQFAVDGYRVEGGPLTLNAPSTLRVGDGSAGGAGYTATIASAIGGSGGAFKTDLGTLILTGTNTYTGGTSVNGGVLQVTGDTNLGAAAGGVTLNGGTLRLAGALTSGRAFTVGASGGTLDTQANAAILTGAIGGSGALAKTGTGALTLTGNSAPYGGTFTLAGGSLRLDGSLGGTLRLNAGTRLTGTGTLANLTAAGTVAPGNGVGTLTATGNVTFASGSTFEVEVNPNGSSDRLVVSGTATLQGGNVSALFLGNQSGACGTAITSTILTAQGGVTGTFAGVSTNFAFLTPSLSYDANNVRLTLSRNAATFSERGATANQRSSGAAAEALRCGNAVFDAIVPLDATGARNAFEQISGEVHASARGALMEDSRFFRDAMLATNGRRGMWGSAYGSWGQIDGDGNAAEVERNGTGAFVGVDLPLGDTASAGIGGGYSRADYAVTSRSSAAEVESWHLGASLSARFGGFGLSAGGAMAWHRFDVERIIAFTGFADAAAARYDGQTRQLYARAGYTIPLGSAEIEPFAEVAWVEVKTDPFAERGGASALSGEASSDSALFSTLGASGTARLGTFALTGRLGWRHAFDVDPALATFAFSGSDGFTISGAPIAQDALVAEAGVEFELGGGARLGASYSGQIGDRTQDHGARATLRLPF